METEKRVTARVGLFVMVGLVLFAAAVFLLGAERGVFSRYTEYTASFTSIEGLKAGSPVRLAGVEVGQVTAITFYDDPNDKRVQVRFRVLAKYGDRIRGDSQASVGSRGLLGDKVIDITLGSATQQVVAEGGELLAAPAADYTEMLKKGGAVLDNAVTMTNDLKEIIAAYNTPEVKDDLVGLISSSRDVVEQVKSGKGALHTLIYDAKTGAEVKRMVGDAAAIAARTDAAVGRVDRILAQVQSGNGLVGAMLYDPAGKAAVQDLSNVANEIGALATAVRTEKAGLLHQLVYGGEDGQPNMGEELAAAARDMRLVVAKIKEGDGSLGALINDPTVYEDLKGILGNVKRNRILRELVRYSISQSDEIEQYGKKE
ncbi:MlaD family protein [Vulgatibacter sp.]|uniref:MlaD family protein n=1 Tax=Vulgatibacter sp. TaxID=1971226 RepID=UPI003567CF4A